MAYSGYKIVTYIDVNPQSPSFNTTRTERVADNVNCAVQGADWKTISQFCEVVSGVNTGYYVTQEMDMNVNSPTYGETRTSKVYNTTDCPLGSTEPNWVIDEDESYCETKVFPSGVEGQTGRYIVTLIDENRTSPTFKQTQTSAYAEDDWTDAMVQQYGEFPCEGVDTTPNIEIITSTCQLVDCSGTTTTNGYKIVTGLDKNPYSDTYLSAITQTVTDNVNCPNNCGGTPVQPTYVFTLSNGQTSSSQTFDYSARTVKYGVISTKDGLSQSWSVTSGSATKTSTGISVSLTENTSTANTKTTSITLTQSESNNTIMITITQGKKTQPAAASVIIGVDKPYLDPSGDTLTFRLTYYAIDTGGTWFSDGVELEEVALDSGMASMTKTISGETDNGQYKTRTYTVANNSANYDKYARFKAKLGTVYSSACTISQGAAKQSGKATVRLYSPTNVTWTRTRINVTNTGSLYIDGTYNGDHYWKTIHYEFGSNYTGKTVETISTNLGKAYLYNTSTDVGIGTWKPITLSNDGDYSVIYSAGTPCTQSSSTYYAVNNITASNVGATVTSNTVSWNYTAYTHTINSDCTESDTTSTGSTSTRVTFSQNTDTANTKTISGTYTWTNHKDSGGTTITIPYSFTQGKAEQTCTPSTNTCYTVYNITAPTVTDWKASANTVTWNYSAFTHTVAADCSETDTVSTGTTSSTVTFDRNRDVVDVTVSGSVTWNNHIDCSTNTTVKVPYSFTHSKYTGRTDGEVGWYNQTTHEVVEETTITDSTACPAGGPTTWWIWTNVENAWDDWEINVSAPSGMVEWARFGTTYANRAKLDLYWSSNCSGSSSRTATITLSTPASPTVLIYRVTQRNVRW